MDSNVPYMASVKNVPEILTAAQKGAVPESFSHEFLKDLGFTSSNDRGFIKILKYLGMLDASGKPQSAYRDFVDQNRSRAVLANRIQHAFDDLYNANPEAHKKTADQLKGWFKTKTGVGDAVAKKIATTFKAFAGWADFTNLDGELRQPVDKKKDDGKAKDQSGAKLPQAREAEVGLVYRLEIHLPDAQNIDTFRAIFRAMREELGL